MKTRERNRPEQGGGGGGLCKVCQNDPSYRKLFKFSG